VMQTTKRTSNMYSIDSSAVSRCGKKTVEANLVVFLNNKYNVSNFYHVQNKAFRHELTKVERDHPQQLRTMKIAVLYSKRGQSQPSEMFHNDKVTKKLREFLNIIGDKIDLSTHKGYAGDMGSSAMPTYYCKWKHNIEIIYHVAPMLNSDQHRRLIGNDVAVIFFQQQGEQFHPENIQKLGTVPQIFTVVTPHQKSNYRLGFFNKTQIKPFGPPLPKFQSFNKNNLRDYLLTKIHNGYYQARVHCPPLNRLFFTPRGETIAQIVQQFPKENKRDVKQREKAEHQQKMKLRETQTDARELIIKVKEARNLVTKTMSRDTFCVCTLSAQEVKTQVSKKSINPQWNEEFKFNLVGLDIIYEDFILTVTDGANKSTVGQVTFALSDITRGKMKIDKWYTLTNGVAVAGEILLQWDYKESKQKQLQWGSVDKFS